MGRFTPLIAQARAKVAADRAALVASLTPDELALHDAEEDRRWDAIWDRPEVVLDLESQDECERIAIEAMGGIEAASAFLNGLKREDFSPFLMQEPTKSTCTICDNG